MAKRAKCRNLYRTHLNADELAKKCEINFLPLVYDQMQSDNHAKVQQLQCEPYATGFGPCPKRVSQPSRENCELLENTPQCNRPRVSLRRPLPLCRLFATCDHAVLLFGGWNNITSQSFNEDNVRLMYDMLRRNGFRSSDIRIFYKDSGIIRLDERYSHGLPASDKGMLRNQITKICGTELCADSFVMYLNGPTTSDGSILLWDVNGDGKAEANEMYTVDELLEDITDCSANHIFIFADQSYAGKLTISLRQRSRDRDTPDRLSPWSRVVLVSSTGEWDYSWNNDVTIRWSEMPASSAVSRAYGGLGQLHSTSSITGRRHAEDFTIYGAQIEEVGLSQLAEEEEELTREHMGCQNLPGPQWSITFSHNSRVEDMTEK